MSPFVVKSRAESSDYELIARLLEFFILAFNGGNSHALYEVALEDYVNYVKRNACYNRARKRYGQIYFLIGKRFKHKLQSHNLFYGKIQRRSEEVVPVANEHKYNLRRYGGTHNGKHNAYVLP